MLKPILLTVIAALAVALVVVVVVASRKPDTFRYERRLKINAAPEAIYPHIVDFRQWPKWSPFENRDAHLERRFSGADAGPGATYAWEGKKAGTGSMTITKATPARDVLIDLNFTKPFEASNLAEFTLKPDGDGTEVTWIMTGESTLVFKVMGVLLNLEKSVLNDFDTGLANLKRISERAT